MQIKRFFKYFGISIAILVGGVLVAGQIAYQSIPIIDASGKMYSVNGTEIHMYCTGPENDDQPTIIIISGGGTPSPIYSTLQENLSKTIRTCSYDSAGLGWSDPNDVPYTTKNMSDELYQLLQTAQIDGPIILAGHSLGGIVSLIYSAEHEEQVAGIAFIDSSHYNQVEYFGKEFSDTMYEENDNMLTIIGLIELGSNLGILTLSNMISDLSSESEAMKEEHKMMAYFDRWAPPYPTIKSMVSNLKLSLEQGKEAHYDRGDLPIIAISASDKFMEGSPKTGLSEEEMMDAFMSFHKDLADLSNDGRHVIVNGTNHMSIVYNDKTADHILSLIPNIES